MIIQQLITKVKDNKGNSYRNYKESMAASPVNITESQPQSGSVSAGYRPADDKPVNVQYPGGHVVTFPSEQVAQQAAPSVWQQLKSLPEVQTFGRELSAFGSAVNPVNLAKGIYKAAADPLTPEEQEEFHGHIRIPGEVAVERLTSAPIVRAANWYKDAVTGKVPDAYEQALSVAPEGVGTAGGTVVLGKAIENTVNAAKTRIKTATARPAPEEPVSPKPPVEAAREMSPEARAAAAYLRRQRVTDVPKVEVAGVDAEPETATAGKSGEGQTPKVVSHDEANRIAADVLEKTKPTEGVSIKNESELPKTTEETADALARSFVTRLELEREAPLQAVAKAKSESAQPSTSARKPTSPLLDITDEWKQAARNELARKGMSGGSDATVPTFFSKLDRVTSSKVPASASGDQILNTLRNNGVKESEIQWTGVDDFLKGKPKVSKTDLQQYINEHKIQLDEVTKGGEDADAVRELGRQRDKAFAENNRIWADHLRYADGSTELFNAMNAGQDVESAISKLPQSVQDPARRFVETDQMIHDLDKQITEASNKSTPAKYEQYTLPGEKQNYKELLLTLPQKAENDKPVFSVKQSSNGHDWHVVNDRGGEVLTAGTREYAEGRAAELNEQGLPPHLIGRDGRNFKSPHFDEPNVLAHVRFDDRPAVDGKKTLFLEELQSDWAQAGKKHGFQTADAERANQEFNNFRQSLEQKYGTPAFWDKVSPEERQQYGQLVERADEATANKKTIPDMPFKQTWHELALKRLLRHAAENGYDRLAWTTGEQQAARYDLSKHFDGVLYDPKTGDLLASPKGSDTYNGMADHVSKDQLADHIGKDASEKLLQQKPNAAGYHVLSGIDLKVGGEWANAFYDRAIPNFLSKYVKRWNSRVGTTQLKDGTKVHSVPITPEMKKSVLTEGQPLSKNVPQWAEGLSTVLARPRAA
jgi:hypothetical protein